MDEDEFEMAADAAIKRMAEAHPLTAGEQRQMIDQLMQPKLQNKAKSPLIVHSTGQRGQFHMQQGGADQVWGLDFETYSDVDLKTHGIDRYMASPKFRVLIAALAGQDGSKKVFDFVLSPDPHELEEFRYFMTKGAKLFVAHNAAFERAVLRKLGIQIDNQIIDSAVITRCLGGSSALEHAAPQFLPGGEKMPEGKALIQLFCVPRKSEDGDEFAWVDRTDMWSLNNMHDHWDTFIKYCYVDAKLGLEIWKRWEFLIQKRERSDELLTNSMNVLGWRVDVDLVREMKRRHDENVEELLDDFYIRHDPSRELNFNSPQQLARWCKERGVRVTSLDKEHLPKIRKKIGAELTRIKTIPAMKRTVGQAEKYQKLDAVWDMLTTKQEMAGSSLKKLQTILDMVGDDGRLRGQYMHCGAGQSHRTSGRGVQLQNVKRLNGMPDDVHELMAADKAFFWSNEKLASNLRQVFTAGHPDGELIVADFKAIEARVLAWLADAQWKLDAFEEGKDLYRVMAAEMFDSTYNEIAPKGEERMTGKVGELSCGYGAGPGAVRKFASKMGIDFTDAQAADTVNGWRDVNQDIVSLWQKLDDLMRQGLVVPGFMENIVVLRPAQPGQQEVSARVTVVDSPESLVNEYRGSKTLQLSLWQGGAMILSRIFQGVHMIGRDMCYVKPDESRSDRCWKHKWYKDGQSGYYKLYGGKITGILTQSLAREIFMQAMQEIQTALVASPDVNLIGQFHDELIIEWLPNPVFSLWETRAIISDAMSGHLLPGLPVEASIGHTYRYTK